MHITVYKIDDKDPAYSTVDSAPYSVVSFVERESKRVDICITDLLFYAAESKTTL